MSIQYLFAFVIFFDNSEREMPVSVLAVWATDQEIGHPSIKLA